MKRAALLLFAVAACGGGSDGAYCVADADCSGSDVCAHTHECLPPGEVHSVTIHWTISGQAPNATSCAGIDHLDVGYETSFDANDSIGFSPVMCIEGEFPNDKWPTRYDIADVAAYASGIARYGQATIPADPMVDVTVDVTHP